MKYVFATYGGGGQRELWGLSPPPFIGRLKLWFPGFVFTSRVGEPPVKLKGYCHVPPPREIPVLRSLFRHGCSLHLMTTNLCKKVPGKKVSGKKPGNKNFGKSPNFLKSLEKMLLEIKSCVLDSWDFFS